MFSDEELDQLAQKVQDHQVRSSAKFSALEMVMPIGAVIAVLGAIVPGIWFASTVNSQFQAVKDQVTVLQKQLSDVKDEKTQADRLTARQINWIKSVIGNPDGRWTYSMTRDFAKELGLTNPTVKTPDVDYIHTMHMQSITPPGSFPSSD